MAIASICHRNGNSAMSGFKHFFFNGFPQEQNFPSAKWLDVVGALDKDAVFLLLSDSTAVVLDALGKLFGREIGIR